MHAPDTRTLYERVHGPRAAESPAPGPRELPTDGAYPARGVASTRYTFGTSTRKPQDRAPMA